MADQPLVVTPIKWLNNLFSGWVARIVVGVLILLIGFILGKLVEKLSRRLLREVDLDSAATKVLHTKVSFEAVISRTLTYLIYLLSVITALNQLGITRTVLYAVSAIIAIVLLLAILLEIRDFVPNVFAGILGKKNFKAGDVIALGDIKGRVFKTNLTGIFIETHDSDMLYIPNSFIKGKIVKKS
jgi:small-conductance mechanosensitive channel